MNEHLAAFVGYLTDKEKSKSTIESYTRYVKKFLKYVDGNEITKELVIQYRELLEREGSAYSTINLILISINCYFLILEFDLKTRGCEKRIVPKKKKDQEFIMNSRSFFLL